MEHIEPDDCYNAEDENASTSASAENFQKYMLNIFEKNGILNDLRAYLRGHIVQVLRNTQNGKPITSQKYFMQRLELDQQALNMLIVEYLLSMQFNYTISVFISEIPLANMVFDFAKKMLCGAGASECSQLRFTETDIWSVLNFLGVQCDSIYAANVLKMYNSDDKTPLLICLLKCMPMYQKCQVGEGGSESQSLFSERTQDSMPEYYQETGRKLSHHRGSCKHIVSCKICRKRILSLKDKSKKIKEYYNKQVNERHGSDAGNEDLMQHVGELENTILGEMFEELKNVYESEIDLVKAAEEKRVQRTLANHALLLKKQREEMEESLKQKSADFVRRVSHKKQFLSELASSLRVQHSSLTAAMDDVRQQNQAILQKEDKLKEDLEEAERVLRKRGEEMREQISKELSILDAHLDTMRREREFISEEKRRLEVLKTSISAKAKESQNEIMITQSIPQQGITQQGITQQGCSVLQKLIDSSNSETKCIIEKGTLTDAAPISKSNLLNNGQSVDRATGWDVGSVGSVGGRPSVQKVVNDLKRQKNVNFSQTTVQVARTASVESAREDSERREILQRLREENEQLRCFAVQQRSQANSLSRRPQTAPPAKPPRLALAPCTLRLHRSSENVSGSRGAGEAASVFTSAARHIVRGNAGIDRRGDHRRQLINQWRKLRKRLSPTYSVRKPLSVCKLRAYRPSSVATTAAPASTSRVCAGGRVAFTDHLRPNERIRSPPRERSPLSRLEASSRDRSPKSVLREAKQRLRNKDINRPLPPENREKSPNSVLQEAKQRLRKLEIEAEAVERSYRDFRKKQTERSRADAADNEASLGHTTSNTNIEARLSNTNNNARLHGSETYQFLRADYQKYLNFVETYFQHQNTSLHIAKPLPEGILQDNQNYTENYIDTPLRDFRKLYNNIEEQKFLKIPTASLLYDVLNNGNDINIEDNQKHNNFEDAKENINDSSENLSKPDSRSISEAEKLVAAKAKSKKDRIINRNIVAVERKSSQLKILREDDENDKEESTPSDTKQDSDIPQKFNKVQELQLLNNNINQLYNLTPTDDGGNTEKLTDEMKDKRFSQASEDSSKNLLRIELEKGDKASSKVLETNKSGKFILTLESSVDTELAVSKSDLPEAPAPMSILISPKKVNVLDKVERSKTCPNLSEKEPKRRQLKRNDRKASGEGNTSSTNTSPRDKSKDYSNDEYTDDFSQDVDNYTSRRGLDGSPISFAKSLEDENLWEA